MHSKRGGEVIPFQSEFCETGVSVWWREGGGEFELGKRINMEERDDGKA